MATATKRKTKTAMHNPARSRYAKAASNRGRKRRAATTTKRKRTTRRTVRARSASRRRSTRRNPSVAIGRRRAAPRKNPASTLFNQALAAFSVAFGLRLFDGAVQKFAPALSAPIMIAAKGGAVWAIGQFGRKLLGNWTPWVQGLVLLSAGFNLYDWLAAPLVSQYLGLGAPQLTGMQAITDSTTGAPGYRFQLSNGDIVEGFQANANEMVM